jgi:hypothetical protein
MYMDYSIGHVNFFLINHVAISEMEYVHLEEYSM